MSDKEWKEISTAPLGKAVLITRNYNNAPIKVARLSGERWSTGPSPMDYYAKPTHWMELPDKPKQKIVETYPEIKRPTCNP